MIGPPLSPGRRRANGGHWPCTSRWRTRAGFWIISAIGDVMEFSEADAPAVVFWRALSAASWFLSTLKGQEVKGQSGAVHTACSKRWSSTHEKSRRE